MVPGIFFAPSPLPLWVSTIFVVPRAFVIVIVIVIVSLTFNL